MKSMKKRAEGNLTIISGPAASGKTTEMRRIYDRAKRNGTAVLWLSGHVTRSVAYMKIAAESPTLVLMDEGETFHNEHQANLMRELAKAHPAISFIVAQSAEAVAYA